MIPEDDDDDEESRFFRVRRIDFTIRMMMFTKKEKEYLFEMYWCFKQVRGSSLSE